MEPMAGRAGRKVKLDRDKDSIILLFVLYSLYTLFAFTMAGRCAYATVCAPDWHTMGPCAAAYTCAPCVLDNSNK